MLTFLRSRSKLNGAKTVVSRQGLTSHGNFISILVIFLLHGIFFFVCRSLNGCSEYADSFVSQEIDGQALMLLREEHMVVAMHMKLGPALKIVANVNAMKREALKEHQ